MTLLDLAVKKAQQQKICMVTCYDYSAANIVADTPIDAILVGDSVAMVVHGFPSTVHATLPMMVMHTQAVARAATEKFLIADLPFLSYRQGLANTISAVTQLIQAGAQAVKLEGADEDNLRMVQHLVTSGVPVMGHIGLTPQHVHQLGGYKVQGKAQRQAQQLLMQAKQLEDAGCFAIVLECMPSDLAKQITTSLHIPTIGIGAGSATDGQVLVWHDLLGLQTEITPKFLRRFSDGFNTLKAALQSYDQAVKSGHYPDDELHGY